MNHPALHTPRIQQALSLVGSLVVTTALLAGVLGLAGGEQAAQLAQQIQAAPAAVAAQTATAPQA